MRMSVRKTESRIPANTQPSDLGQAVLTNDSHSALISFITSPLVINRENTYVVFVTDQALGGSVQTFEWSFSENNGAPTVQTTEYGEISYTPQSTGNLSVTVRLLGTGNAEQASIAINQEIVELQAEIEASIEGARNSTGPGIGNPEVAREIVNDHSPYHQDVVLQTPESGEGFQKFVFSMVYDGVLKHTPDQRKQHISQLAAALNGEGADFQTEILEGAGVCGIRLALLAMIYSQSPGGGTPLLTWTELPEPSNQRLIADQQLRQDLAELNEEKRIDLFNLVRFPKSNITQCGRIIEALRDRYFSGANFNDVLTGQSGTRAHWIIRHFREGPLTRD